MQKVTDLSARATTGSSVDPLRRRRRAWRARCCWRRAPAIAGSASPALEALNGAGVFYGGPTSEAPCLAGRDVYVLGGANSAGQAALYLARYAERVTLVVRAESLDAGMSHYLVRQIEATPNLEVRSGTEVVGGGGDGRLEHLVLRDSDGTARRPSTPTRSSS